MAAAAIELEARRRRRRRPCAPDQDCRSLLDYFTLLQITLYAIFGILALSLAFIWGYGGILCFGHSAFFGLGAYAYAVAVINIGDSTAPALIAIALPALLAAALGYFMFYARISDVYVGVITLTVTLIFYNVINSTAGPQYHIGDGAARRLQRHAERAVAQHPVPAGRHARAVRNVRAVRRAAARGLFRPARGAGDAVRPRAGRGARERAAGRISGLRRAAAQARGVFDRRRACRTCRLPVRGLGQLRQPDGFQRRAVGADHHLADGRRRRHAARPGDRRRRDFMADGRNRHPADRQRQRSARRHSAGLRSGWFRRASRR